MTVHRDMRHVDESNGLIKAEIKREEREKTVEMDLEKVKGEFRNRWDLCLH